MTGVQTCALPILTGEMVYDAAVELLDGKGAPTKLGVDSIDRR